MKWLGTTSFILTTCLLVWTISSIQDSENKAGKSSHPDAQWTIANADKPESPDHQSHLPAPDPKAQSKEADTSSNLYSGALVVVQKPNWEFDTPLVNHIAGLIEQADNGDLHASYVLALNLRKCFNVPEDRASLESKVNDVSQFSDGDKATEQLVANYAYCEAIDRNTKEQFYDFLLQAAEGGYVAAQEYFGRVRPTTYMQLQNGNALTRDAFIAKRDAFNAKKLGYLEAAASRGSIQAMIRLTNMYGSQNHGSHGVLKQYLFNQLIMEFTTDNEVYRRYDWFQQRLYSELSAKEIEQIAADFQHWKSKINQNGTLYPLS